MDFRIRQLKRALEPLREALESHHRSLEGLESTLIEFEEPFNEPQQRQERPQAQPGAGSLDLLSITDVCQELGMGKSWVYRRIQSGEIPSVKLGRNIKVRREDLEGTWRISATSRCPEWLAEFFSLTEHLLLSRVILQLKLKLRETTFAVPHLPLIRASRQTRRLGGHEKGRGIENRRPLVLA